MSLDLNQCDPVCRECIQNYIKKHKLKKGDSFDIVGCKGIPLEYVPADILSSLGEDPETVQSMLDPVLWAKKFLDWHCIDLDGSVWKRKHEEGSLGGLPPYDPLRASNGKSIFHRPYQKAMLSCTSKRKVFRLGRQSGKTEALCIVIAFNIFTNEKFHVEVIAPYQSQIDLIFKRLSELIGSNSILANSILRNVKAPQYTIELKNGSQVIGFTAGTRSKQEAGAARGQHANMLIFDESDYLSPADIDAALAVIINFPNATVWMSSTPTGRREKFFESCKNKQYREFHFPSQSNPNWTPELEAYFRAELTTDGYQHEIEALFGQQEEGVYQLQYIEAAQSDFKYEDMNPIPSWIYMIGVDWNDVKVGTVIAIVGFDPVTHIFHLVRKYVISRTERTQLSACEKIAELNRMWHPAYIYIDAGFGSTQEEILHDFGQRALVAQGANSPDARLRNIVKSYDFGSSIEIRDPFTKQPVKKAAKPFLVENSVRKFENLQFKYPQTDKSYTDQLQGYIIDRISQTGRPIYKAQNESAGDHLVDAVNLALVAFTLEQSKFSRPVFMPTIAVAGRFGESRNTNIDTLADEAKRHYPKIGRADAARKDNCIFPSENGNLPAANTSYETTVRPWVWPGFATDGPKPQVRTLKQAFREAEYRVLGNKKRRHRPRRSKF